MISWKHKLANLELKPSRYQRPSKTIFFRLGYKQKATICSYIDLSESRQLTTAKTLVFGCSALYSLSLYSLDYAEAVNVFAGLSPHHCARATLLLSKKCCCVGNTLSGLICPRFECRNFRSRSKRVSS